MGTISVNKDVLIWARKTSNVSIDEVASKMNKDVDTIKLWEEGIEKPTYVQLEKLAYQIYKRPIAVFFFPEPPQEVTPKQSLRTLPDFEYENLSYSVVRLFRQAQAMQLNLYELSDGENISNKRILDDIPVTLHQDVISTAKSIRDYLGISLSDQFTWNTTNEAFKTWRSALEDCGVFIFKEAFRDYNVSGFCLYDNEFPVIYINNSFPKTRQIFTLFHELAHLLFRTGGIDKKEDDYLDSLSQDNRFVEVFCNLFAGEFLVPTENFNEQISGREVNELLIVKLAEKYSVSREVILRKLLNLKLIDEEYYKIQAKAWIEEAKNNKKKTSGGNYYATKVVYLGDNYLNLVFSKYYNNKINSRQTAEYLNVKVENISSLEIAYVGR